MPNCKYFDYGRSAPRELGAYCTEGKRPIPVKSDGSMCKGCASFTPVFASFAEWFEYHHEDIYYGKLSRGDIARMAWNAAIQTTRRL